MLTRASASAQRERMRRLVVAKVGGPRREPSRPFDLGRKRHVPLADAGSEELDIVGARKRNPSGTSTTFSTFSTACWAWKPTTSSAISGSSASVTHALRSLSARCDRTLAYSSCMAIISTQCGRSRQLMWPIGENASAEMPSRGHGWGHRFRDPATLRKRRAAPWTRLTYREIRSGQSGSGMC
jgi:hypothetical protein